MFKKIFQNIVTLGISPISYWKQISDENEDNNDKFFNTFLFPYIGITTLITFISIFLNKKNADLEFAIKSSSITFVSFFVGFFVASFLLKEYIDRFVSKDISLYKTQKFVGYVFSLG